MASSKEIFISPTGYDSDISAFENSTSSVGKLNVKKIKTVKNKTELDSMEKIISILNEFQNCIDNYRVLSEKDIKEMKNVKEQWIRNDEKIGNDIEGK